MPPRRCSNRSATRPSSVSVPSSGEPRRTSTTSPRRSKGIAQVGLDGPSPVINGVIMSDTVDQAVERAGAKVGNKGFNAALNAIEMADLATRFSSK